MSTRNTVHGERDNLRRKGVDQGDCEYSATLKRKKAFVLQGFVVFWCYFSNRVWKVYFSKPFWKASGFVALIRVKYFSKLVWKVLKYFSKPFWKVSCVRILGSYHGFVSGFVSRTRIQGSYSGFVSWIRIQDSYSGLVSRVRIQNSYSGFVFRIRI